jgi:hypothetical protein
MSNTAWKNTQVVNKRGGWYLLQAVPPAKIEAAVSRLEELGCSKMKTVANDSIRFAAKKETADYISERLAAL